MKRSRAALIVVVAAALGLLIGSLLQGHANPPANERSWSGASARQAHGAAPSAKGSGASASTERACARESLIGAVIPKRVTARAAPTSGSRAIASFERVNPERSRQVFLLDGAATGPNGGTWYRALLPMRPNGTHGYVPAAKLRLARTPYRLDVDTHRFTLTVWRGCRRIHVFSVGIGKGETPTPHGRFYLVALIKPPTPNTVYGAYAYGLSAFSKVITTWKWGGVIGLHGTNDPSSIGHDVSHGCIRMHNSAIRQLVRILPLGTPITIH